MREKTVYRALKASLSEGVRHSSEQWRLSMSKLRSRPLFLDDDRTKQPLLRHSATLRIASHNSSSAAKLYLQLNEGRDVVAVHSCSQSKRALWCQPANAPPLQIHMMTLLCGCTIHNIPNEPDWPTERIHGSVIDKDGDWNK